MIKNRSGQTLARVWQKDPDAGRWNRVHAHVDAERSRHHNAYDGQAEALDPAG